MKRGFTLIEILISVVLLGLISLFVSSTIFQAKKNVKIFKDIESDSSKIQKGLSILHDDLLQSYKPSIINFKRYSIVRFRSKNSIYGVSDPYILWLVMKKEDTLVRLESAREIGLPVRDDLQKWILADAIVKNCNLFQIKLSKDKKNYLIFIKIKKYNPILFEVKKL